MSDYFGDDPLPVYLCSEIGLHWQPRELGLPHNMVGGSCRGPVVVVEDWVVEDQGRRSAT